MQREYPNTAHPFGVKTTVPRPGIKLLVIYRCHIACAMEGYQLKSSWDGNKPGPSLHRHYAKDYGILDSL